MLDGRACSCWGRWLGALSGHGAAGDVCDAWPAGGIGAFALLLLLTSQLTQVRQLTPHTSHLTPHTSHLTHHTSHLTPHTSHLTHHTSHLTPHTLHLTLLTLTPCCSLQPAAVKVLMAGSSSPPSQVPVPTSPLPFFSCVCPAFFPPSCNTCVPQR